MNAFTRGKTPFYLDDLMARVCLNTAKNSQSITVGADTLQDTEKPGGWFTKFTGANYKCWRHHGSQSYGP